MLRKGYAAIPTVLGLLNFLAIVIISSYVFVQIKTITETSLSANQDRSAIKRMPWKVEGGSGNETAPIRGGGVDPSALVVELGPMEIRTFILQI